MYYDKNHKIARINKKIKTDNSIFSYLRIYGRVAVEGRRLAGVKVRRWQQALAAAGQVRVSAHCPVADIRQLDAVKAAEMDVGTRAEWKFR